MNRSEINSGEFRIRGRIENKLTKLKDMPVWVLEIPDRYDRCMTMCRAQEYYESPNDDFRGNYFPLYAYMTWYAKTAGDGVFTYPADWTGFNIPVEKLISWHNKLEQREDVKMLSPHESLLKDVVDLIKHHGGWEHYLICVESMTTGEGREIYEHELLHAKYATDKVWNRAVNAFFDRMNDTDMLGTEISDAISEIMQFLADKGYNYKDENIMRDECQAYILEPTTSEEIFNYVSKETFAKVKSALEDAIFIRLVEDKAKNVQEQV